MKAIVTADLHIGISERHDMDIVRGFREIAAFSYKESITIFIIAGDIFNTPRPLPHHITTFANCLNMLSRGDVWLIDGNHDANGAGASSLAWLETDLLANYPFVKAIGGQSVSAGKSSDCTLVPFSSNLIAELEAVKTDCIVTHIDTPERGGSEREIQIGFVPPLPESLKKKSKFIVTGHIHKHQSFAHGNSHVVYPGSLARVTFAEENEPKGFLSIDTADKSWDFIERKTARTMETLELDWREKIDWKQVKSKADDVRVRVTLNVEQKGQVSTLAFSDKLPGAKFVKVELAYAKPHGKVNAQKLKGFTLADLEQKYVATKVPAPVRAAVIQELAGLTKDKICDPEFHGLELKNVTISDFQTIEFLERNFAEAETVGIVGEVDGNREQSNGAGKTSVLEAVRFALYGDTRFPKNSAAIRYGSDKASVQIGFKLGDELFLLERTLTDSGTTAAVHRHGNVIARGSKEVTAWVQANPGLSCSSFDSLVFFGRNRHAFSEAGPTERMRMLQDPLPLGHYAKAQKVYAGKRSAAQGELQRCVGAMTEVGDAPTPKEIETLTAQVKKLELQKAKLKKLQEKEWEAERTAQSLAEAERNLKAIAKPKETLKQAQADFTKYEKAFDEASVLWKNKDAEIRAISISIKTFREKQAEILKIKSGVCPVCGQQADAKTLLTHIAREIQKLSMELNKQTIGFGALSREVESLTSKLRNAKYVIEKCEEIAEYETEIAELKKKLGTRQTKNVDKELNAVESSLRTDQYQLERMTRARERALELKKKKKQLERDLEKFNALYAACSPAGIPAYVVARTIDAINDAAVAIIEDIGFWQALTVRLEANEQDCVEMWASVNGDPETSVKGLSTGEREIVNLVIQLARRQVLDEMKGLNYSFILVDEALDNLDAANMQKAISFFRRSNLQALVVSHGEMRDAFPSFIVMKKKVA